MSNALISLPIVKYSFCTEPKSVTKGFSWKHVHDVLVVFDSFRSNVDPSSSQSQRCMKVIQGTNTLEFVDIEQKARESREVIDKARLLKIELRHDQLSSLALHRRTERIIAMRYSLPDNYIRRVQLRFNSVQDFDTALSTLEQIGMPHSDSVSPNAKDAPKSISNPASVVVTPPSAQPVFQSTVTNSNRIHSTPSEYFAASEARKLMVGSLGERSSDSYLSEAPVPSDPPLLDRLHSSHRIYRSMTCVPSWSPAQHYRPFAPLPTIAEHDREIEAFRPGPSDLDYRHLEHPGPRTALTPRPIAHRPFEAQSDLVLSSLHSAPENTKPAPTDGFHNQIPRSDLWNNNAPLLPATPAILAPTSRPLTAPISHFETGLEDMVPPRRELPFKRRSTPSGNKESSRPSTASNLVPLRKPSLVGEGSSSHVAASRPQIAQSNSARRPVTTATADDAVYNLQAKGNSPTKGKGRVEDMRPPTRADSASSTYEALRERSSNTFPAPEEQIRPATCSIVPLNNGAQLPGSDSTVQPSSPVASANFLTDESFAAPLKHALQRIGPYIQSESNNKENLNAYASLSNEERRAVLENSVIELINDDGFAQLCEDLYGVWQRIGLGP